MPTTVGVWADVERIAKRFRSVGPRRNPALARVRACQCNVIADASTAG